MLCALLLESYVRLLPRRLLSYGYFVCTPKTLRALLEQPFGSRPEVIIQKQKVPAAQSVYTLQIELRMNV